MIGKGKGVDPPTKLLEGAETFMAEITAEAAEFSKAATTRSDPEEELEGVAHMTDTSYSDKNPRRRHRRRRWQKSSRGTSCPRPVLKHIVENHTMEGQRRLSNAGIKHYRFEGSPYQANNGYPQGKRQMH